MSTNAATPEPWENPIKARLRQGLPVIGITITTNSVETTALAASLGFDLLWIEMEHSPVTLETVRNIVLATRGMKAVPFVRVPLNELWTAKRVLDSGALGVIFPFTSTPEMARQAVAACKYPPHGKRGSGAGFASFCWPNSGNYYDFADRNVVVVVIIEEIAAVERIEEIAAIPGIDVLFVGPSDLSFSMGWRGDMNHSLVHEAMAKVVDAARRHGKTAGCLTTGGTDIARCLEQGFRFIQCGTELNLMADGAQMLLEKFGRQPEQTAPTSYVVTEKR
ncbi:MAG TPA: aldolase/citrate lyase family protein [Candidatus Limnocylindria bacterium]|jgi:2-keto-3-deoxy-L-rhamnonate aldolase RhmA|nr:aldolase/citrate lyase family protein [Candidatus Limnocylindria bacterium]